MPFSRTLPEPEPGAVYSGSTFCGGACIGSLLAAEEFTPAANYTLKVVQVLIGAKMLGSPPGFDVFLYSGSNGVPGSEIEQIGFDLTATAVVPGSLVTANA
jgi:hypothetical protein